MKHIHCIAPRYCTSPQMTALNTLDTSNTLYILCTYCICITNISTQQAHMHKHARTLGTLLSATMLGLCVNESDWQRLSQSWNISLFHWTLCSKFPNSLCNHSDELNQTEAFDYIMKRQNNLLINTFNTCGRDADDFCKCRSADQTLAYLDTVFAQTYRTASGIFFPNYRRSS